MSKSKSHPCRHPEKAVRTTTEVVGALWCHKCKQNIDVLTNEVILSGDHTDPCPEPVPTIMEGSPSGA